MTDAEARVCTKCETEKPLTDFYPNGTSKGGRMTVCSVCIARGRRVTPAKVVRNRAEGRARRLLVARHRAEYDELLREEIIKATAERQAVEAEAAARGQGDADVARLKRGPRSQDRGETSTLDRLDVARCPSCHQHHDRGHACPSCGDETTEHPDHGKRPHDLDVDWAVVERRLSGDKSVPMNTGERREIVRRARARGMSLLEIQTITGIQKPERYLEAKGGAA